MKLHLLAASAALVLAACGGGGGGSGTPMALDELQGFWTGDVSGAAFGGATKARAVVLPDGRAWLFLHDAATTNEPLVGLATAQLAPADDGFTGTGKRYPASGDAVADFNLTGSAAGADALAITAASAGSGEASNLAYDARYETAAVQADVAYTWVFTQAGGTIDGSWTIAANGALTGTRTPGCTYSGQVVPHTGVALYDVSITESCSGDAPKAFTGIARLNSAKDVLTFGLTTTDGAQGAAFGIGKALPT